MTILCLCIIQLTCKRINWNAYTTLMKSTIGVIQYVKIRNQTRKDKVMIERQKTKVKVNMNINTPQYLLSQADTGKLLSIPVQEEH